MTPYAQEAWGVYVKQQYLEAGLLLLLTPLAVWVIVHVARRMKEWDRDNSLMVPLGALGAVICGVFLLYATLNAPLQLVNPEYYAIKSLLKHAGGD